MYTSVIFLLIAIVDLPYGYYIILRILIFSISIMMIISSKYVESKWFFYLPVFIAIIYNPIIPIYLSKANWVRIDVIVAIIFICYHLQSDH